MKTSSRRGRGAAKGTHLANIVALGRETWLKGSEEHHVWAQSRRLDHHEFWLVRGGEGTLDAAGRSVRLTAGTGLLLAPKLAYKVRQNPRAPLSISYLEICLARGRAPARTLTVEHLDLAFYDSVMRRILDLCWEAFAAAGWKSGPRSPVVKFTREADHVRRGAFCPDPIRMMPPGDMSAVCSLRLARDLACTLLDDFMHRTSGPPAARPLMLGLRRKQRDAITVIADRITEDPGAFRSTSELARAAGYSSDHFSRLFHRVIGSTPSSFTLAARIDAAKRLLATSPMTIKEIADRLGYKSVHFFSRQFKKLSGTPPTVFRARHVQPFRKTP